MQKTNGVIIAMRGAGSHDDFGGRVLESVAFGCPMIWACHSLGQLAACGY